MMAKAKQQEQFAFAGAGGTCACGRCGAPCRVNPTPNSTAKMLKRADRPKGLCLNCAVHNVLRNLYPANLILARSGPQGLALPHVQRQFFTIARMAGTDARLEEIDWQAIIANWELPFPTPMKRTAMNPVTQAELDVEREEGESQRSGTWKPPLGAQEQRAKDLDELNYAIREFVKDAGKDDREDTPPDHSD